MLHFASFLFENQSFMNNENLTEVVAKISEKNYKTEIFARQHIVIGDEPLSIGGEDLGMMPFELLLGSLGECTAITLRMYAARKAWDVKNISVKLTLREISTEDKTSYIKRTLSFEGDLTEEQKNRMLQIANACPVHKLLTNPIQIQSFIDKDIEG
jgi:putative redox protein